MLAHDSSDCVCRFVGIVEGDGGAEMVQYMSTNNAMEQMFIDIQGPQAEAAVDGCGGAASKVPGCVVEVREGRIRVLEIGNNDYIKWIVSNKS